jgi:hypothetical protein
MFHNKENHSNNSHLVTVFDFLHLPISEGQLLIGDHSKTICRTKTHVGTTEKENAELKPPISRQANKYTKKTKNKGPYHFFVNLKLISLTKIKISIKELSQP